MSRKEIIIETVEKIYTKALCNLPRDVKEALYNAYEQETVPLAKETLRILLNNIDTAKERSMTICQDTGLPQFFVKIGTNYKIDFDLEGAIREGIMSLTKKFPLIPFVVHPLTRENTKNNTGLKVPIIYYDLAPLKDYIEITAIVGPAQPQNFSKVAMLSSYASIRDLKRLIYETVCGITGALCPPLIVGIGIGGLFDNVTRIAKEAAIRPLNLRNSDPKIAKLELEIQEDINKLGIGHMALGGKITALAVNIELGHTHLPCLPVAIQLQCWCLRRAKAHIHEDGSVEEVN